MNSYISAIGTGAARSLIYLGLVPLTLFISSCGGSGNGTGSANGISINGRTGTGSIAQLVSTDDTLVLPVVKVGDQIQSDVRIKLKKDFTWTLLSSGAMRAATPQDKPSAVAEAATAKSGLTEASPDVTLTVNRMHIGSKVFAQVGLRLVGRNWSFIRVPQEVKALHAEDFASSALLEADESHHVMLTSHVDSGLQTVPMHLQSRSYRFCMEAQAEGADTTTLFDSTGATVFNLKAGDDCITIKATDGSYKLQHRYGGSGASRTIFMRHDANTKRTDFAKSVKPTVPLSTLRADTNNAPASSPITLKRFTSYLPTSGEEYWAVRSPTYATNFPYSYLTALDMPCQGGMGFAATVIGIKSLLRVDGITNQSLASPLGCTEPADFIFYGLGLQLPGQTPLQIYPQRLYGPSVTANNATGTYDPRDVQPLSVNIVNQSGNVFQTRVQYQPNNPRDFLYSTNRDYIANNLNSADGLFQSLISTTDGSIVSNYGIDLFTRDDGYLDQVPNDIQPLIVGYKYFPDGLQQDGLKLDVGQVALYGGDNCTGAALVTSDDMGSLDHFSQISGNAIRSIQVGLSTRANLYGYPGEIVFNDRVSPNPFSRNDEVMLVQNRGLFDGPFKQFNKLSCNPVETLPNSILYPYAVHIQVDTVTFLISTDSCEKCNLTGADFSSFTSLANAKLSGADLDGVDLSNHDLSGIDLRYANLQGANLDRSNLDRANLCGAFANKSPRSNTPGSFRGAHLKDANLSNTNLSSADFTNASFISSDPGKDQVQTDCTSYQVPTKASANGAVIENTIFASAYLSRVDLSSAKGVSVDFTNATLFGVSFISANLDQNAADGRRTRFTNANLQGSNFTGATLRFADFTGAQVDTITSCIQILLNPSYANFQGSTIQKSKFNDTCLAGKPTAAFCVSTNMSATPKVPATDCSNICADGSGKHIDNFGACSAGFENFSCSTPDSSNRSTWTLPNAQTATAQNIGFGNLANRTSLCPQPNVTPAEPLLCTLENRNGCFQKTTSVLQ